MKNQFILRITVHCPLNIRTLCPNLGDIKISNDGEVGGQKLHMESITRVAS